MTGRRIGVVAVAALAGLACDRANEQAPAAAPAPTPAVSAPAKAPDAALLARGEYLVEVVMGCAVCHTPLGPEGPDLARRYAGGLAIEEPFGTWVSTNITQDRRTGIGAWTDEQILDAIREGKRPNGDRVFPIMPYLFFNRLSDEDGRAVVAYLRTIPPVEHAVPVNRDLKLPKIPAPPPAGTPPADDPVARGEYLATLMHCAACHVPVSAEGKPDMSRAYAGGMEIHLPEKLGGGVVYASNITPDPKTGIGGRYDEAAVVAAITRMTKVDGAPIRPPMALYGGVWARLTPDDARAVATFILQLPPIENAVPAARR